MRTRKEVGSSYSDEVTKGLLGYFQRAYSHDQTILSSTQARDKALTDGFTYAHKHKIDRQFVQETLAKVGYDKQTAAAYVSRFYHFPREAKERMAKGKTTFHTERRQVEAEKKASPESMMNAYHRAVRHCNMHGKRIGKTKFQHLSVVAKDWARMIRGH